MCRHGQRLVDDRLIFDDSGRLDAAGRRDDQRGSRVVDAGGELARSEAAEDDGVHGAEPRAGQHGNDCFGHHRHIDDDAVAFLDAQGCEAAGKTRHLIAQLAVAVGPLGVCHRRVPDQGRLITAAPVRVPIQRVERGVQLAVGEPPVKRRVAVVEPPGWHRRPIDRSRRLEPELVPRLDAAPELGMIGARSGPFSHRRDVGAVAIIAERLRLPRHCAAARIADALGLIDTREQYLQGHDRWGADVIAPAPTTR